MTALRKALGLRIRVTGAENLVDRPTLFVANHFTRIETFLVPYVIFQTAQRMVRSLGTHVVFKGLFGRYFRALGGMSTRDPRRNRTIVSQLITGKFDWIIYPEGGLIKNKKTIHGGRLRLEHPERHGPPHTGAAMLALKAEIAKRRYMEACTEEDHQRIEFYEEAFGLEGPDHICGKGIVVTPVTLSFYPMRPSSNLLNRLAKFIAHDLDPRLQEELTVEGSILLAGTEIDVHFGEPIEVASYLGAVISMARRVVGAFSEATHSDLFLRKHARKLTTDFVRAIYQNTPVNFDHLFCYALRLLDRDRVPAADFHRALYLAATDLADEGELRLHPSVTEGIEALVTGVPHGPLESVVQLATRQKILERSEDHYAVDRKALEAGHEFHTIRLKNMVQVIANELEPLAPAVAALTRHVNRSAEQLRLRTTGAVARHDRLTYQRDYEAARDNGSPRPEVGEPFMLEGEEGAPGVVLVHGYLAAPEQMRPLAEYLNEQGCHVYAVRLKGHGTLPRQLVEVTWRDWIDSVSRGVAALEPSCERIILGGFSLGGILSLLLAAGRPDHVDGVFSINAPFILRDRRMPLVPALLQWNGAMRALRLADGHYRMLNDSECPEINYETHYLLGVQQLRVATERCRRRLGEIRAQVLLVQSDADPVVSPAGARKALGRIKAVRKKLVELPFDRHVVVFGDGSRAVFETVWRFIERVQAAEKTTA
ncbi:MAG: alpha/beta fold hydrolase [Planctomycetota bacterium]